MNRRAFSYILGLLVVVLAGCSQSQPTTLRVLSYNIHHAQGLDKKVDLERIANVIRQANPDLVALQEVDNGVKRSDQVDQAAKLGELTGMKAVFEKNIDLQGGGYGNAVLSKLPIASHKYYQLPRIGNNEQRGLIEMHVTTKAGPLVFLATHLDHQKDDAERIAGIAVIRKIVEANQGQPILLAGDFNTTPDTAAVAAVSEFLANACTGESALEFSFPADKPNCRIDYVFCCRCPRVQCTSCEVIAEPVASDHRPVLVVFELKK